MADSASIQFLTVGTSPGLIEGLWSRIESQGGHRFAHLVHPGIDRRSWPGGALPPNVHVFADDLRAALPAADERWLASLAGDGVPTLHNMILGDRVVSTLPYGDALRYATLLARRLAAVYEAIRPQAVIGAFDALHSGLSLAVARSMGVPWFALHFSVMPPGMACLCDRLSPASRVGLQPRDHAANVELAEGTLTRFERRQVQVAAYIAPAPRSLLGRVANAPRRVSAALRTASRWRQRHHLRFSVPASSYSLGSALGTLRRLSAARAAASDPGLLTAPPPHPFVLFGLHMQPESSIDVWAPFFSNQKWVIELLSRSLPPTHRLLVKIHKSDVGRYTRGELREIRQLPGVELVAPFADARQFIQKADLIMQIQGTIGLEAALMGKPVIMLGESPFTLFPSVSPAGRIGDLPALVREKLSMPPVRREAIIEAFASYLAPFESASDNDWQEAKTPQQIAGYCRLFDQLLEHLRKSGQVTGRPAAARAGAMPC